MLRSPEQLAELVTYLQRAEEEERVRLARILHDEFGSLMSAAKFDVARIKQRTPADAKDLLVLLAHLDQMLDISIVLTRNLIENLRPSSLATLGLVATLEILAREWQQSTGIKVQTSLEDVHMEPTRELALYRVAREALLNISHHAQASQVRMTLENKADSGEITVIDDGTGFNPEDAAGTFRGLASMCHNLETLGGALVITSAPDRGTRIVGRLPR